MFHHVVLMEFSARADVAFFDTVERFCERIRATAPNLRRYVFKPNVSARSDQLGWAIVSSFDSSNDHSEYQASSVHQEMKAFMTPFIQRIVVCDVDEVNQ